MTADIHHQPQTPAFWTQCCERQYFPNKSYCSDLSIYEHLLIGLSPFVHLLRQTEFLEMFFYVPIHQLKSHYHCKVRSP